MREFAILKRSVFFRPKSALEGVLCSDLQFQLTEFENLRYHDLVSVIVVIA